jgi:hypothetical protein
MKRGFTAALLVVAALSLSGCDQSSKKIEAKQPESAEIKIGKPYLFYNYLRSSIKQKKYKIALNYYRGGGSAYNLRVSAYNLGVMYVNGFGVPKDYLRAYMWWNIAASFEDKDAITYLGLISNRMTPTQLSQADEMVRKCQANNYQKCD